MKSKFLMVIFAAFLCAQSVKAQFHIGVKGGANIIKVQGQSFKDEFRYGYHLGAFMEIRVGKHMTFNPEVLFNQYNTTLDSNFSHIYQNAFNPYYQQNVRLGYLSIPLILNMKLIGPISLQVGPQVGILINKNKNLLDNGSDAFKHGDFSMLGGAQVKLGSIRLTGRYVIGLNNINDIDNQDKWKSQGWQLSLGFAL